MTTAEKAKTVVFISVLALISYTAGAIGYGANVAGTFDESWTWVTAFGTGIAGSITCAQAIGYWKEE